MTREEAILWMQVLKHSKVNWVGEQDEDEDIIARCEEAEQEAFDMAIEALNNSIQMSNIQQLEAENGSLKEMVKYYREQQTDLVRCKDCKNWRESHSEDEESYCYIDGRTTDSTGYCSWGERREE